MILPLPLRERGMYDGMDETVTFTRTGRSGPGSGTIGVRHNWSKFDHMTDRINPKGKNGYRLPGPCYRVTQSATPMGSLSWIDPFGGVNDYYVSTLPLRFVAPATVIETVNSVALPNLLPERLAAWNKFQTQVPSPVSLANFLFELKDFSHLLPNLLGIVKGKLKPSKLSGGIKGIPSNTKKVASIANSTFLNYNFAWAPFVSDMQALSNICQTVFKRLDYLRRTRGVETRVHYYHPNLDVGDVIGDRFYNARCGIGGSESDLWLELTSYKANFAASCTMLQELEGLDDAWAEAKAIFAGLGFNNPLGIVWNAIPFSFMLDWILPVNKLLTSLAAKSFAGRWDIYDVVHSVKTQATLSEWIQVVECQYPGVNPAIKIREHKVAIYNRYLGLPLSLGDVGFTNLTDHQQMLFLSLVAGNTLFRR